MILFKIIVNDVNFFILLILVDIGNVIVVVVVWGNIDKIILLVNCVNFVKVKIINNVIIVLILIFLMIWC